MVKDTRKYPNRVYASKTYANKVKARYGGKLKKVDITLINGKHLKGYGVVHPQSGRKKSK
ncbi:MAG: hypothetical protein US53_C0036G0003 [Candidatus Woesebacteria bacterium GW2011_GWA1_37_7]|uniref:Uncharacterized protein n=1 Tax=Candidatus Woesebacteria bacterium GW2011_GWA1_37_7 TaxID=1618545 RepID=A0A0G0K881_9BACT|nr:MAG: hypothetical protein US53_C0036G0003 [Candidatus Woesebacteria bacterium GW2011_GWA1_37_7]